MRTIIRDWLTNVGLVLVGAILLVSAFWLQLAGKRAADDAAKSITPAARTESK